MKDELRIRPHDSLDGRWCVDHYDGRGVWQATQHRESKAEAFKCARTTRRRIKRMKERGEI